MKWKSIILLFAIIGSSCATRKVKKSNERIKLVESATIKEKAPGDNVNVFLPYPLPNPERPKAQSKVYKGEKGATVTVDFDTVGVVKNIVADCPEVDRTEQRNKELDYRKNEKDSERAFNLEAIKVIRNGLVVIGFFFALAFWAKGR